MTFGSPDRPASGDYFYYESTRRRWESEGLPKDANPLEYFGMDFDPFAWKIPHPELFPPVPDFGTTALEETEDYRIERRPDGEVVRVLKNVPPPAMPQWISYPLQTLADWPEYKRRLDPDTPQRLPADFPQMVEGEYRNRDYPLGMWVGGTYGYLRNWWGVENLSMLLFDNPALIEEMIETLTHLALGLLDRVLSTGVELDWVMFWEDLAYKSGPLISPAMFRKFCLPFYHQVMDRVHSAGIPIAMVDSDGNIEKIIPMWLEVGVTVMHPMEVAAGMDVAKIRSQYGKSIGFFGGVDKRVLASTPERIRAEIRPRLESCFADGGYISACDHAIPPDVSLDNYRYYRDLVAEVSRQLYGG